MDRHAGRTGKQYVLTNRNKVKHLKNSFLAGGSFLCEILHDGECSGSVGGMSGVRANF